MTCTAGETNNGRVAFRSARTFEEILAAHRAGVEPALGPPAYPFEKTTRNSIVPWSWTAMMPATLGASMP